MEYKNVFSSEREHRNVFSDNPFIFMADFEQAIKDGYRLNQKGREGWSNLSGILKEVRMFRGEGVPEGVPTIADSYKEIVNEYNADTFLQKCQSMILGGYTVDSGNLSNIRFTVGQSFKCTFVRDETVADVVVADVEIPVEEVVEQPKRGRRTK